MRMLVIANAWGEMRMRGGRELFNQAGLPALEPPEEEGENSIHLPFSLAIGARESGPSEAARREAGRWRRCR